MIATSVTRTWWIEELNLDPAMGEKGQIYIVTNSSYHNPGN
jgi:hypothetical protein